uniref:Uncharacterized protein n=1 Tax=Panagrolaimus sp. ES5 TaxID=591445 RepID=A0AC34G4Q0_9BILA
MNETKKAIKAMKSVLDQNLMEEDIHMDEVESYKQRKLVVQFCWLKPPKLTDSGNNELKKGYLQQFCI